jgi:acyl carrier protein
MTEVDVSAVQQQISERLPHLRGQWQNERPLAELKLDSLDTVELLMVLDELYAVRLSAADLAEIATVGQFCELVARRAVNSATAAMPCSASK